MVQRAKLELDINEPTEIELLFDEPITGESRYGNYYMYAVKADGNEYSYFATEDVHNTLKELKRGNKAVITKTAQQKGSKLVTSFDVEIKSGKKTNVIPFSAGEDIPITNGNQDRFYEIMLQSYRDALAIQRELNGLANPERVAVTLFIARSKTNNNGTY